MGRKDIGLKSYFRDTARYADLWNGGVFQGRQMVLAQELREVAPVYMKADQDVVLERAGDLVMMQSGKGGRYAVLALENQEKVDYGMPVRIMIQEALEYDRQMKEIRRRNDRAYKQYREAEGKEGSDAVYRDDSEYLYKFRKEDRLFPIATLVVYWGEERWQGAKNLHEMIDFGDVPGGMEFRKLIPKYPLHFLDLSNFRHLEYFRTELRLLFGLFQRRNSKNGLADYIRENGKGWSMDAESWHMLGQMIGSGKIRSFIQKNEDKEEEKMGNAFDELIEDWISEGMEKGKAEGKAEGVIDLLEDHGAIPEQLRETILKQTDISVLKSWLKLAARSGSIDEFVRLGRL